MRIALVEVREEGSVRQMLQTGRVVGHDVGVAREVAGLVAAAMFALMHARDVAQRRRRPFGGDSALVHSTDRWGVVTAGACRGTSDVMVFALDGQLPEDARMLKVAVGDRASRVVLGHQPPLHFVSEWVSPHMGLSFGVEAHSAHSGLGSIGRAQE